jgi:starch synthase
MRVLHAAAELYPWVKTGGLGDVVAGLPPALAALGIDTRLVLPGFRGFLDGLTDLTEIVGLQTPFAAEPVRLACARVPGSKVLAYLVDHPDFYDRPGGPYVGPQDAAWTDNHRRFGLLGWVSAALAAGADPAWRPDILHGHDWHAALAHAYVAADLPAPADVASVFTIHNLAYQAIFPAAAFAELGLPADFFSIDGVEYWGQVSLIKAGLNFADRLTTVSPTYAREIQTPEFGAGLDGLLRRRAGDLVGILNGVDPLIWDPAGDRNLPRQYGRDDADAGKAAAKAALQHRLGLDEHANAPLFGVVSRIAPQKGLDLLLAALPELVAGGAQLVLLGSGEHDLERAFAAAAAERRGRVAVEIGYYDDLSHLIVAGADVMLVPSRYEPCGLTQLYALRYGALPLVRRVGGLSDTVAPATAATLASGEATGFAFDHADAAALATAVAGAIGLYAETEIWRRMVQQAMRCDFTWTATARRYQALYTELRPQRRVRSRR